VKCYKKHIKVLIMINILMLFVLLFTSGCDSEYTTPEVSGIDPNPAANPENNTVSSVKVTPLSSSIKVNQSLQLVVRGYNSDDEWVILDKSKVILWKWTVMGLCYDCVKDDVKLTPKSGSLSTTFSSGMAGTFYVVVYYQENIGDKDITDYTEVKVVK